MEDRKYDPDPKRQMEFGERLAGLLLPPYARELFLRSLAWARDDGIRLRLRLGKELLAWPWEYLYLQRSEGERTSAGFVALDPRISIVRHQGLARPTRSFGVTDKRRVVVAMATPEPHGTYRRLKYLPREKAVIGKALKAVPGLKVDFQPPYQGDETDHIPGARFKDVRLALTKPADIFHFAGHGDFVKRVGPGGEQIVGEGSIILADENNRAVPVPGDLLADLFRGSGVRLVVLGACDTGRRDALHVWSSVAAALLESEVSAVLAMQYSIYDDLAAAFMAAFYEALVAGYHIDQAVAAGRTAIRVEAHNGHSGARDWGVPVLYLRSPGGRIFNPVRDEVARKKAEKRASALVEQQVTEVGKSGRVVGAQLPEIKSTDLEIVQMVEDVKGVVIGLDVLNFEGGNVKIDQTAGVVTGELTGLKVGEMTGSKPKDQWSEVDKLLRDSYQLEQMAPSASKPADPNSCPKCGKPVQKKWEACPYCKSKLSSEPTCPQCGEAVKDEWKSCPFCTADLRGDPVCPNCGELTEPDWKGCAYCGADLND